MYFAEAPHVLLYEGTYQNFVNELPRQEVLVLRRHG